LLGLKTEPSLTWDAYFDFGTENLYGSGKGELKYSGSKLINHLCRGFECSEFVTENKTSFGFSSGKWRYSVFPRWGFEFRNLCWDKIGNSGSHHHLIMDPSWSDMKHILRRREEIVEGNRVNFRQVLVKISEIEQIVTTLLQCMDNLELER
jgi:hypothetical protein